MDFGLSSQFSRKPVQTTLPSQVFRFCGSWVTNETPIQNLQRINMGVVYAKVCYVYQAQRSSNAVEINIFPGLV